MSPEQVQDTATPHAQPAAQAPAEGAQENGGTPQPPATPEAAAGAARVRAYDFRRPRNLSAEFLKTLHRVHNAAADALAVRLSRYLGVALNGKVESVEEIAYGLVGESLPEFTYVATLDLGPLTERGQIILDTPFCLAYVDRALGGPCRGPFAARALTAVDQAACEGALEAALRSLRDAWKDVFALKLTALDRRNDARGVALAPASEPVLVVTLLITGEIGENRLRLVMPVNGLKSTAANSAARVTARPGPDKTGVLREHVRKSLERASLTVVATVGTAHVSLRALKQLRPGDVIQLDRDAERPVLLTAGGRPAFVGTMGLRGRHKAVQIVERLDPAEED